MIEPRRVEDTQREIYRQLANLNSPLTDQSQGSVLYTLTRTMAMVALASDQMVYHLAQQINPALAQGEYLDEICANHDIHRRPARYAQGFALIRCLYQETEIYDETTLVEPQSGQQFKVNIPTQRKQKLYPEVEVRVPIVALQPGAAGNLPAGTPLVCLENQGQSLVCVVGSHRNSSGHVIGNLIGGEDGETDEQLRQRLFQNLILQQSCSEPALASHFYKDHRVLWVSFANPMPGHTQVWVELEPTEDVPVALAELQRLAEAIRPVGTSISVHKVEIQRVNIEIRLSYVQSLDRNTIHEKLKEACHSFCRRLRYGTPFYPNLLERELNSIHPVKLLKPSAEIAPLPYHTFRPNSIEIHTVE